MNENKQKLKAKKMEEERTLKSLKRLGAILEGQRISTEGKDGEIVVEVEGIFQSVWRYLKGESRAVNIAAVERKFLNAYEIVKRALDKEQHFQDTLVHPPTSSSYTLDMERMSNLQLLMRTRKLMSEAIVGFRNLIPTYKNKHDQNIEADIMGASERIEEQLQRIDTVIESIRQSMTCTWREILDDIERTPEGFQPQPPFSFTSNNNNTNLRRKVLPSAAAATTGNVYRSGGEPRTHEGIPLRGSNPVTIPMLVPQNVTVPSPSPSIYFSPPQTEFHLPQQQELAPSQEYPQSGVSSGDSTTVKTGDKVGTLSSDDSSSNDPFPAPHSSQKNSKKQNHQNKKF
jgi:hypothetical protein